MRIGIFLLGWLCVGVFPLASQRAPKIKKADTAGVRAFFKDTGLTTNGLGAPGADARSFDLQAPGQRDSLRAILKRERELWRTHGPRAYRYLLRVGCFCPGTRGWLLMEVRSGQPLRAWTKTGQTTATTDWNTFSIDGLFDNLEGSLDRNRQVQIAFDPRWHFPAYVRTVALQGPDAWGIFEARGLRPL